MFQKSIEAVVEAGVKRLGELSRSVRNNADEADEEVKRCRAEIAGLVVLAKDVPEKVFDRYSNVMVASIDLDGPTEHWQTKSIHLGNAQQELRGLMGDEVVKAGKYRVIVLLEPLEVKE